MLPLVVTHQTEGVALGVLDESHPFVCAGRPQPVIEVTEDELRLGHDLGTVRAQGFDLRPDVIDFEVDQRACHTPFEEEAYRARLKEQQARRIKEADGWCVQQALVKFSRPTKIIGVLRDLQDVHGASVARGLRAARADPVQLVTSLRRKCHTANHTAMIAYPIDQSAPVIMSE
jgi:hypothetical protein